MKNQKARLALTALGLLGVTSVIYAAVFASVGAVNGSGSPGAAAFTYPITISLGPLATGGGGDQLVAVHEGRDDNGPYVCLEWVMGPPNVTATVGNPPVALFPTLQTCMPSWLGSGGGVFPGTGGQAGNVMNPGPGNNPSVFCTYRPTNDPANPGWAAPPATAGAGQLEAAIIACHQFAEAVRRAEQYQEALNAGTVPIPPTILPGVAYCAAISFELNLTQATPGYGEFYKYNITTR